METKSGSRNQNTHNFRKRFKLKMSFDGMNDMLL